LTPFYVSDLKKKIPVLPGVKEKCKTLFHGVLFVTEVECSSRDSVSKTPCVQLVILQISRVQINHHNCIETHSVIVIL